MPSLIQLRRKAGKAIALARYPLWRRGLKAGVAAAIEHRDCLSDLDFSTCIDVGANCGQFTLLVRAMRPDCMIFAFEPLARPASKFREVHGEAANVRLFETGLGARAEDRPINVTRKDDSSSFLAPSGVTGFGPGACKVGEEQVRVERLDDVLSPADLSGKTLLKLDVQGFEDQVLEGATALLPHIEWVYTEAAFSSLYAGQPLFDDLHSRLLGLGFTPMRVGHVSGTPGNVQSIIDILYRRRPDAT